MFKIIKKKKKIEKFCKTKILTTEQQFQFYNKNHLFPLFFEQNKQKLGCDSFKKVLHEVECQFSL
jgi:hypothetical protein